MKEKKRMARLLSLHTWSSFKLNSMPNVTSNPDAMIVLSGEMIMSLQDGVSIMEAEAATEQR